MSKQVLYTCDFNPHNANHAAHWCVEVTTLAGSGQPFDLCSRHLVNGLIPILNNDEVVSVIIKKMANGDTPKVTKGREGARDA